MTGKIRDIIQASIETKMALLKNEGLLTAVEQAALLITTAFQQGHKLYCCGNGGSAADAQHIAAEFTGRFYKDRAALPAEALHTNSSYLTSVANDYGFEQVYSRLIEGIGQPGDVLIGLSTSGNSPNIVHAFEAARKKKMHTIAFTGETGRRLQELSSVLINIPSSDTPRIQESHILVGHIICQLVEEKIFSGS